MDSIEYLGNFNHSLARFDRDPTIIFDVFFYEESVSTVPITINEKQGVAIGVNSHYSVQRALTEGWHDISDHVAVLNKKNKIQIEDDSEEETIVPDLPTDKKLKITEEKPAVKKTTRRTSSKKTTTKKRSTRKK